MTNPNPKLTNLETKLCQLLKKDRAEYGTIEYVLHENCVLKHQELLAIIRLAKELLNLYQKQEPLVLNKAIYLITSRLSSMTIFLLHALKCHHAPQDVYLIENFAEFKDDIEHIYLELDYIVHSYHQLLYHKSYF